MEQQNATGRAATRVVKAVAVETRNSDLRYEASDSFNKSNKSWVGFNGA